MNTGKWEYYQTHEYKDGEFFELEETKKIDGFTYNCWGETMKYQLYDKAGRKEEAQRIVARERESALRNEYEYKIVKQLDLFGNKTYLIYRRLKI